MKNESTLRETPQKWLWRPAAVREGGVSPPVFSPKVTLSRLNRIQKAREILRKLVRELNERLAVAAVYDRRKLSGDSEDAKGKPATVIDRRYSLQIELDQSAEELILREGFSEKYGARNLERTMDSLLGGPLAAALLAGQATGKRTMRVSVTADRLHFQWKASP